MFQSLKVKKPSFKENAFKVFLFFQEDFLSSISTKLSTIPKLVWSDNKGTKRSRGRKKYRLLQCCQPIKFSFSPHFIEILSDFLHDISLLNFFKLGLKGGRRGVGTNWVSRNERRKITKNKISQKIFFLQSPYFLEN